MKGQNVIIENPTKLQQIAIDSQKSLKKIADFISVIICVTGFAMLIKGAFDLVNTTKNQTI